MTEQRFTEIMTVAMLVILALNIFHTFLPRGRRALRLGVGILTLWCLWLAVVVLGGLGWL